MSASSPVAELTHGDHCCLIYTNQKEQIDLTVPFLASGLSRRERTFFTGHRDQIEQLRDGLKNAGIDPQAEIDAKRLLLSDNRDYLDDLRFRPGKMLRFLQQTYDAAMADGFTALRGAGDVAWEVGPEQSFDDVIYYEAMLELFFLGKKMVGMCQYSAHKCPPDTLSGILGAHKTVAIGKDLCRNNVHYVPADLLLEKNEDLLRKKRYEWMTSQLVRIKKAEEENKKLREQFHQAQKMEAVGQLAGGIAHDFNNILTTILGICDIQLQNPGDRHSTLIDVAEIKSAAGRAAVLTQQLLAFSRQQVLQPRVIDLGEIVKEMERMLRRLLRENIDFVTEIGPNLWAIRADLNQIEQVVMNLVVNARDAMPNGGTLLIRVSNVPDFDADRKKPCVKLSVADTGMGMSEETKTKLFNPFFTTKEKGKGTGLGLSTVYGIVKQSGGDIRVHSAPGSGSVFDIYFPRVFAPVDKLVPAEPKGKGGSGTETILVVEDEAMVRKLLARVLRQNGYRVLEAHGPKEAIEICLRVQEPIPLLLTDMVMPGMDGRALARQLQPLHPEMKVIYMSGYTDNMLMKDGMLEPGIEFLEKPMTPDVINRRVRDVLDKTRS